MSKFEDTLPWSQHRHLSIPGWGVFAVDTLQLYALVPFVTKQHHDWAFPEPAWDQAVIFTTWGRVKSEFVRKANRWLASIAEGGKVGVLESGRDCDGVEYSGRTHVVDADWGAFEELDDEIGEWADGPYRLSLCRVSETLRVRYESRDLVMEAHEDGHPHAIYSEFA